MGVFIGARWLIALGAKLGALLPGAKAPGGNRRPAPAKSVAPSRSSAEPVSTILARTATETVTLLENHFPEEPTPLHGDIVRPSALLKVRGARWYDYVVLEDGTLVIGERSALYGHANLAQGRKVRAAGQVQVSGGRIVHIDNASGHYLHDGGPGFAAEALGAFRANGFPVPDAAYIPKYWNPQTNQWEPIDAIPNRDAIVR